MRPGLLIFRPLAGLVAMAAPGAVRAAPVNVANAAALKGAVDHTPSAGNPNTIAALVGSAVSGVVLPSAVVRRQAGTRPT